jgi:membrane-bound lytic murein transglycosylase A
LADFSRQARLGLAATLALSLPGCFAPGAGPLAFNRDHGAFNRLTGWDSDSVAAAIPAFLRSCRVFLARGGDAPLDRKLGSGEFGRIGDWHAPCAEAAALRPGDDEAARQFFETRFTPVLIGSAGATEGLFTGYYETVLDGSRRRNPRFQVPIYRRPANPRGFSRAQIEAGALAGHGLELAWVDDPIGAFFLEIQGSGRVKLAEGGSVRVGYDGQNGHPYVAVGKLLIDRGQIARENMSMGAIRAWMTAHPREGAALRRENPSVVFFRELAGEGPIGAEGVSLTAGRSLAVDRHYLPLGVPVWIETQQRFAAGSIRRLVIAQDTGGAIKGQVRGDLYWGGDEAAAAGAGTMNSTGHYYVLLPRAVAARAGR